MSKKYIVKSEAFGTYLTYANEIDKLYYPNREYAFRHCCLQNAEAMIFNSYQEAEQACIKALKEVPNHYAPFIIEIMGE